MSTASPSTNKTEPRKCLYCGGEWFAVPSVVVGASDKAPQVQLHHKNPPCEQFADSEAFWAWHNMNRAQRRRALRAKRRAKP